MNIRRMLAKVALFTLLMAPASAAITPIGAQPDDLTIPRYGHIFLIIEENHGYESILQSKAAPNLSQLARTYGVATRFYATTHPSEPNYVALFSGSTYGITDDKSFTVNSLDAPNLATQLQARRLTWGGYFGGYDPEKPFATSTSQFYASKHNPFVNFKNLRKAPGFTSHQHTLERLSSDLQSGSVANFTLIVPGLCTDMHGAHGCDLDPEKTTRGDQVAGSIVGNILKSPIWRMTQNAAIVITWDENDDAHRDSGVQGCCGALPGGGRIPTIVITNHGPHNRIDSAPYNQYSLLRTIEDAFGIYSYLGQAGNWAAGVRPMTPLFR